MGGLLSRLSSSAVALSWPPRSPRGPLFRELYWFALCGDARGLMDQGAPLLEAELQRYEHKMAPHIADITQQRADADTELQDILALPSAEQAALQERKAWLQDRIGSCTAELDRESSFSGGIAAVIHQARATRRDPATHHLSAAAHVCSTMLHLSIYMSLDQSASRPWLLRLDSLWSTIADALHVQDLWLTAHQCDVLLWAAVHTGALKLIPPLMKQPNVRSGKDGGAANLLLRCCMSPHRHVVSLQPYLRLFRFGLDPTVIGQRLMSALQMARNFVREHPAPAVEAEGAAASSAAVVGSAPLSILGAWALQQMEPTEEEEKRRRKALHARFMHALIPAWRAHSEKVLSLLSSPSVLIPDLAVIVGRYLDLEGLPTEPVGSVDEGGEEDTASAEERP